FRLPADWFPDGTNILYLHVNYTEIESTLNLETGGLVSFLDVQLNNQAVASVALNRNTTGEQTLVIPLRTDLLADTSRRDHSIQMTLRAEDHCLANSE